MSVSSVEKTKKGIYIMTGKCAKQETIAIIECLNGRYYIGSNFCRIPQTECPRKGMPTGEGYDICHKICYQNDHAEVNACREAGNDAKGGTLYLLGHTYCCDNCKETMNYYGIKEVIIGKLPDTFMSKLVTVNE